jgi:hypothetical protein
MTVTVDKNSFANGYLRGAQEVLDALAELGVRVSKEKGEKLQAEMVERARRANAEIDR